MKASKMITSCKKFNMGIIPRGAKAAFLLIFLTWGLTGCSSFKTFLTESRFPDRQIIIDGGSGDWAGNLFVVKGEGVTLGFLNDQEYLYICLRAEDNGTRGQILRSGLTVWFDPKGGKKKALGIKFPIGMPPGEWPMPREEYPEEPEFKGRFEENLNELQIIRSEKEEPEKMEIADAKGIEIKLLPSGRFLVYELKIPLVQSEQNPIAVGAQPGRTIGVGFETGKLDFGSMARRPGRMPGGGGMPPMGGSFGRGGMGRIGGARAAQIPEELKIWATVKMGSGENREPAELISVSHGHQKN